MQKLQQISFWTDPLRVLVSKKITTFIKFVVDVNLHNCILEQSSVNSIVFCSLSLFVLNQHFKDIFFHSSIKILKLAISICLTSKFVNCLTVNGLMKPALLNKVFVIYTFSRVFDRECRVLACWC